MEKRDGGGKRYKYAVNYKNQQSEHLTLKNGAKFLIWNLKTHQVCKSSQQGEGRI